VQGDGEDYVVEYWLNGELIYTVEDVGPADGDYSYWNMYLNARNNGETEFESNWSELVRGYYIDQIKEALIADGIRISVEDVGVIASGSEGAAVRAINGGIITMSGGSIDATGAWGAAPPQPGGY